MSDIGNIVCHEAVASVVNTIQREHPGWTRSQCYLHLLDWWLGQTEDKFYRDATGAITGEKSASRKGTP